MLAVAAKEEMSLCEALGGKEEELVLFQLRYEESEPSCERELALLEDPDSHGRRSVCIQFFVVHVFEGDMTA